MGAVTVGASVGSPDDLAVLVVCRPFLLTGGGEAWWRCGGFSLHQGGPL
jgi:hypothetical protein